MSSGSVERVRDSLTPLPHLTTGIECEPTDRSGLPREIEKELRPELQELDEIEKAKLRAEIDPCF